MDFKEQTLLEEAKHFISLIWDKKGAGALIRNPLKRELLRAFTDYTLLCTDNEEKSNVLSEHYLKELDNALKPFREFERYILTSEDALKYSISDGEYINQLKRKENVL